MIFNYFIACYYGEKEDIATQNRYNYTLSNSYKYVDRDGNKAKKPKKTAKKPNIASSLVKGTTNIINKANNAAKDGKKKDSPNTGIDGTMLPEFWEGLGAIGGLGITIPILPWWGVGLIAVGVVCIFAGGNGLSMDDLRDFKKNNPKTWEDINGDQVLRNYGYPHNYVPPIVVGGTGGYTLVDNNSNKTDSKDKDSDKSKNKYPGNDGSKSPGDGWEWRGEGKPGSGKGNWYNPETGESLHPDLNHPEPVGPHWDFKDSNGKWWRLYPDGSAVPK